MTREEAIKILKAIRVYECYPKSASEETKEAIDMAIEALKAKTDGDLISRQDAIDAVDRVDEAHMRLKGRPMLGWCTLLDEIESLPSAEPKTGEWIQKDMYADRFCSECDYAVWDSEAEEYNFCPNCGADMRCGESDERREEGEQ